MIKVMNTREKKFYWVIILAWIVANIIFWRWWFQAEHVASLPMYVLMSVALMYETTILPSFYFFFVGRMRRPMSVDPQSGLRVAMVTLCVPHKESIEVIERQLRAMVDVFYPHDSWVLDEDNDPRVKILATRLGVKYFSRRGMDKYNQPYPPFQAKTKAGNVNAWVDVHGDRYEFFTQLDIDHNPRHDYLHKVLGHFGDEKVAWVQAPSIYGNLEEWTARGSAEQELVLQGPLQMGFYGWSQTPFIIGSHTTYRMSAICKIGGFQPTRAEDHLDTVVLARYGYRGVFVPEPIAKGDGPESFDIYLAQQFAWAYSMIQVLFCYMPRYVFGYTRKQAVQFLFAQTWYTFWSTSMAVLFLLPCLALLTNTPVATVPFGQFMVRYLPVLAVAFVGWFWTKRWFQPKGLMLSWRGVILHIARWPIVLLALINVIMGVKKPYMITAKGLMFGESRTLSLKSQIPYFGLLALSFLSLGLFLARKEVGSAQGYLLFVLEGIAMFTVVYFTVLFSDIRSMSLEGVKMLRIVFLRTRQLVLLVTLCLGLVVATILAAPPIAQAIAWSPLPVVRLASMTGDAVVATRTPTPVVSFNHYLPRYRGWKATPTAMPTPKASKVALGVYDPGGTLDGLSLQIQHSFVVWFLPDDLTKAVEAARRMRRFPLISLEPWPLLIDNLTAETLLEDVNAGRYDGRIRDVARAAKYQSPQMILMRWGHEMELNGLYPWCKGDHTAYVSAYRRVVDIFREEGVQNVLWVWSPGGNSNAEEYYPGDSYVDYIGVTILADERWDREAGFVSLRSFETLLREKYRLAEEFNKPLIVAEAGVSTTDSLEKKLWLENAKASFSKFPLLVVFVYFNDVNTHSLEGYKPDWSVSKQTFKEVFFLDN